ncbi:acyl-CoA thioesterase [Pedomonas mirosovicensis]|uniref:acyl-CoA thioesterase n=1 Tax=Pedomonas mirosovicensis TaxID=2908641 RepID=UPI0021677CD5|nr:thioesterase family protein [Pedomonas mirosovicensis]MCH8685326.1 acyl-CoA thioesterase [Pedomonas mirosovicensis]
MEDDRQAGMERMLQERASFRHFTQERIRFSDTDMVGHVNNTAYAVYCETGRVEFNRAVAAMDGPFGGVIARVAINMRAETYFPGTVEIGTGVLRIGRTSYTLGQGLFVGDTCVATAEGVIVVLDRASRKPLLLPDDLRAALRAHLLPGCEEG